jgi:predicted small lipoprotein YifL
MQTHIKHLLKSFALALSFLTISACGGGGDDNTAPADKTPTEQNFFAKGIYTGEVTDIEGRTSEMVAIIGEDGTFEAIDTYYGSVFYGVLKNTSSNQASGSIRNLAAPGYFWTANGEEVIDGKISITQSTTDNSISGSTSYQDVTQTNFTSQSLQDHYDNPPSDFGVVAGKYSAFMNNVDVYVSIDAEGAITGSDTTGCNYSAQLQQAVTGKNIYNLTVTVTKCGSEDGNYKGKSFFIASPDSPTQFALIAHDNTNGAGGIFTFQFL